MNKKIQRELYGPSWTEVILGALLSLLLGVALAAAFLVFKPVTIARELPAEPKEGVVYYLEGSRNAAKARLGAGKEQVFLQGGTIELSEDELNAWAGENAPAATQPAPSGNASGGPAVASSAPNFRIRDGVLQIAVPVDIKVLGLNQRVILQARGGFEKDGETWMFEPSELLVGSCPLQRVPFVQGLVMKRVVAAVNMPDEVLTAWRGLSNVVVDGSTLRLEG
ncbi:MAG TPA: hypothetical protein VEA63_16310 [Opitutus sp.]|nr:hypothetical protein [Opitutus sp.]